MAVIFGRFRLWAGFAAGLLAGAGLAQLAPNAAAETKPPPPLAAASGGLAATALSVIDGDTFEARVAVFPGQEIVTRIRIAGLDAPERRGRCASERRMAEEATEALRELVEGRRLTLSDARGDKYFGRVVARVATAGDGDVAAAMIAAGRGRAYEGGRREGWC